ncbi:hypothetical protein EmuJ_000353200 [Echinococcus multilocularis]|uniref:Uncharacterized protein n=1 Tax=Echinococcus multilocularis TaxID=6211 RepID=A0A068XVQ9_ECHMU|nr:hypothetical protein EmuJ_000353200 [Echinococcus multilocularis]
MEQLHGPMTRISRQIRTHEETREEIHTYSPEEPGSGYHQGGCQEPMPSSRAPTSYCLDGYQKPGQSLQHENPYYREGYQDQGNTLRPPNCMYRESSAETDQSPLPRGCCCQESEQFERPPHPTCHGGCQDQGRSAQPPGHSRGFQSSRPPKQNPTSPCCGAGGNLKQPSEMCYEDLQKPRIPSRFQRAFRESLQNSQTCEGLANDMTYESALQVRPYGRLPSSFYNERFQQAKMSGRNPTSCCREYQQKQCSSGRSAVRGGFNEMGPPCQSKCTSRTHPRGAHQSTWLNAELPSKRPLNGPPEERKTKCGKRRSYDGQKQQQFSSKVCVTLTCQQPQSCKCDTCRQTCSTSKKPSGEPSNTCPKQQCPPLKQNPSACTCENCQQACSTEQQRTPCKCANCRATHLPMHQSDSDQSSRRQESHMLEPKRSRNSGEDNAVGGCSAKTSPRSCKWRSRQQSDSQKKCSGKSGHDQDQGSESSSKSSRKSHKRKSCQQSDSQEDEREQQRCPSRMSLMKIFQSKRSPKQTPKASKGANQKEKPCSKCSQQQPQQTPSCCGSCLDSVQSAKKSSMESSQQQCPCKKESGQQQESPKKSSPSKCLQQQPTSKQNPSYCECDSRHESTQSTKESQDDQQQKDCCTEGSRQHMCPAEHDVYPLQEEPTSQLNPRDTLKRIRCLKQSKPSLRREALRQSVDPLQIPIFAYNDTICSNQSEQSCRAQMDAQLGRESEDNSESQCALK